MSSGKIVAITPLIQLNTTDKIQHPAGELIQVYTKDKIYHPT